MPPLTKYKWLFNFAPLLIALGITAFILLLAGAPPLAAFVELYLGAFGTDVKTADVVVVWVSLALCSAGLLLTFTAGQWNIGIEGQITLGSIFATGIGLFFRDQPGWLVIPLMIVFGALGGALWAAFLGMLKTFGKVHEIFGGLGLNFVATALSIYLIFGPWQQATGGTLSGTEIFPETIWLPMLPGLRASVYSTLLAILVLGGVYFALRGTVWGLQLKAVGKSVRGAHLLGIPTNARLLGAYALCGACAGLAGACLVVGVHHRLIPGISSGYGFLGILIVLLAAFNALWVAPIALFFAAVSIGSTALQLELNLDSSLGGVLQATIVLVFLLVQSARANGPKNAA